MTAADIVKFAKEQCGIELFDAQVKVVQSLIENDHVQLTRNFGRTTAAMVAREILKKRKE